MVLQHLSKLFGEEALHPLECIEQDWSKEEYSGGCPGKYFFFPPCN